MNVAEFFGKASDVVARNDGAALVIGRLTMVLLGVFAVIALLMLIIWLAQQCIGARPQNFEHFEDSWETKLFVPYLQDKLKGINELKKSLNSISDSVENAQDDLEGAKENICTVTEDIHDNYINARMSGIDPNLVSEPKDKQDKRIGSRKERAEKSWKRRQAEFKAKRGFPVVECFDVDTSTSATLIVQISTVCDDINDTVANITELSKSPEFQDVITRLMAIEGSIQFTTPFLVNNATVTGNNVATIRNIPKPENISTDVSSTKTEGFDGSLDPDTYYKNKYPEVAAKEAAAVAAATTMISSASHFLDSVKNLVSRSKNSLDVNNKTKATSVELQKGNITPAYMDEK